MNRYDLDFLSFRRWASVLGGLLLIVFGGFWFFNVSAQTEAVENPAEHPLVNGKLAFSTLIFPFPNNRVASVNPDGSGQAFLPITASLHPTEPAWSPDGNKIAFSSIQLSADIYVINTDGSGETNLTNTPPDIKEGNPSWSVTGKIAYHRNPQTTTSQIWVMNPDGSGQAQFPGITQPFPFAPAWSPDGTKLAFVSNGEIWAINADGTNERRVTTNTSTDTEPAWSPDGTKIVFTKTGAGISVINADGTNETALTSVSGDIQPAWSPDATKIAFRRVSGNLRGIYTTDANGGNQVRILADIILFPQCCDTTFQNPAWQPVAAPRRARFDFDGDGRADLGVFRPLEGRWYLYNTANGESSGYAFGQNGDALVPADYDGDGKTDVAVFRHSLGAWYINRSAQGMTGVVFGSSTDIPAPADFDGDGRSELAVFRPSTGAWYIYNLTTNQATGIIFGQASDRPIPADYDGDGKADLAVYREGIWYVQQSRDGFLAITLGTAADKLVPADYDGDGTDDLAVYRPSAGVWLLRRTALGATSFAYGQNGDIPVPADYDGDGTDDLAVYRPSNGIWYLRRSTAGFTGFTFGSATDAPLPNSFVR